MDVQRPDVRAVAQDAAVRAVVRRWRELTGGRGIRDADRQTLVACSGGADSTALALALAARGCGRGVALGHVVHDLRGDEETAAERDGVAALASGLGVGFVEAAVAVRGLPGNTEANARRERYRALEGLAAGAGCAYVATAHHADDQLETMLMAMVRGAGVGGLAGMAPARRLGRRGVVLVRPMLGIGREDAERVCSAAGVGWATDPTNADTSRLRAALRYGVVRELAGVRPGASGRAAELAEHLREVAGLLGELASGVACEVDAGDGSVRWSRAALADEHPAVAGAAVRAAFARVHGGRFGDRLPARSVRELLGVVRDGRGGERRFAWKAAEVVVRADEVVMRRVSR